MRKTGLCGTQTDQCTKLAAGPGSTESWSTDWASASNADARRRREVRSARWLVSVGVAPVFPFPITLISFLAVVTFGGDIHHPIEFLISVTLLVIPALAGTASLREAFVSLRWGWASAALGSSLIGSAMIFYSTIP